jgi:hypothetical protein
MEDTNLDISTWPCGYDTRRSQGHRRQRPSAPDFLDRHVRGDWGEVNQGDWKLNNEAVCCGERILSAYRTLTGERL